MGIMTEFGEAEINENGYYQVISENRYHGRLVHRLVMKDVLYFFKNNYPNTNWVVHHRNRDKLDNNRKNLVVIPDYVHRPMHQSEYYLFSKLYKEGYDHNRAVSEYGEIIYNTLESEFNVSKYIEMWNNRIEHGNADVGYYSHDLNHENLGIMSIEKLTNWRLDWVQFFFNDLGEGDGVLSKTFLYSIREFLTYISGMDRITIEEQGFYDKFFNLTDFEINALEEGDLNRFEIESLIYSDLNSIIYEWDNDYENMYEEQLQLYFTHSNTLTACNLILPKLKSFLFFISPSINLVLLLERGYVNLAIEYVKFFQELGLAFISVDGVNDKKIFALNEIIQHMMEFLVINGVDEEIIDNNIVFHFEKTTNDNESSSTNEFVRKKDKKALKNDIRSERKIRRKKRENINKKAKSLFSRGKHEEAIKCYDKVLKDHPRNKNALNGKGKALNSLNMPEEAIEYFDKVLRINPRNEDALNGKSQSLNLIDRYRDSKFFAKDGNSLNQSDMITNFKNLILNKECENCGAFNKKKSDFCEECGNSLNPQKSSIAKNKCENCGTINKEISNFCEECGNSLNLK